MRKLIITVMVLLTPFALYIAGCRRDDNAASFPRGPEVKGLARSAGREQGIPEIAVRPATIDREILAFPDDSTIARINAVMDREAQLANRHDSPGLYMLAGESTQHLASVPQPTPVPALAPVFESRLPGTVDAEFWSRSPAYASFPQQTREPPPDVYAMVPAAEPLPEPVPVASWPTPAPVPGPLTFPESIPGLYRETPQSEPPPNFEIPGDPADWLGLGATFDPNRQAPILSASSFESVAVDRFDSLIRESPRSEPAASDPGARLGDKLAALLNNSDVRQALEPLPALASQAPAAIAAKPARALPAPALPAMAAATSSEQLTLDIDALLRMTEAPKPAKAELKAKNDVAFLMPAPPKDPAGKSGPALPARDVYRMDVDFWKSKLPHVETRPEPAVDTSLAALPPSAAPEMETPRKIALTPLRSLVEKPRPRNSAIDQIDAAAEVPPLRF